MKNKYFSEVFTRELNKWKKENHKTQEHFAEAIGVEPNMITRYKDGSAHPKDQRLELICTVLCVDKSIFFPQTPSELYESDEAYRNTVHQTLHSIELDAVKSSGIDLGFWGFIWRKISCMNVVFPVASNDSDPLIYKKHSDDSFTALTQEDLNFVCQLQNEVIEFITMQILKKSLNIRLNSTILDTADFKKSIDTILSAIILEILESKEREAINGND